MDVRLQKSGTTKAQTLVCFAAKDEKTKKPAETGLPAEVAKILAQAVEQGLFNGEKKETVLFRNTKALGAENVLLVGVGAPSVEAVRVAAAVAFSALKGSKARSGALFLDNLLALPLNPSEVMQAATEGLLLSDYEYDDLKTKPKKEKNRPELTSIELLASSAGSDHQKAFKRAQILSECQNFSRRLGDAPGNYMTPSILADETVKEAKGSGLKVTVWDKARIKKERFGGLLAVAAGSDEEPRFIVMEYKGAATNKKPVCFVGKGLTFDCGGISIKPSAAMEEMKYDMCGGAAVIGAMLAIAKLGLKINAIGLVPSSENLIGPSATKPGDVYIARNGKSVEVFNTDAEGRLILGDALAYASEQKPAAIFDAATLTGAIVVALGNTYTGVFTRDKELMAKVQTAADATGEWVWPMPLDDFHVEDMKGLHADLCNISSGRMAGSSTAAAFLEQFVDREIPWAHFDIAGTAWNVSGRLPYHPKKSASGVMVRTFVELAESI